MSEEKPPDHPHAEQEMSLASSASSVQQTTIDLPDGATASDVIADTASGGSKVVFHGRISHGPLPPAAELAAYRDIDPELPSRIVAMAERAQAHAHEQDRENLALARNEQQLLDEQHKRQSKAVRHAQWFAFGTVIVLISAAFLITFFGYETVGGVVGGGSIVMITIAFLQSGWGKPNRPDTSDQTPSQPQHANHSGGDDDA